MHQDHRKSIDNGIWLCSKHHRIIDADEDRFTVELLRHWKLVAERRAQLRHELGSSDAVDPGALASVGLACCSAGLACLDNENQIIGDTLVQSCVAAVWGPQATRAVRDLSIELCRNAFVHGLASRFEIDITPTSVVLRDDGGQFDPTTLLRSAARSGGVGAVRALFSVRSFPIVISYERAAGLNLTTTTLVRSSDLVREFTRCSVTLTHNDIAKRELSFHAIDSCGLVYVVFGEYCSLSDIYLAVPHVRRLMEDHEIVIILPDASDAARRILSGEVPEAVVLEC
jgi:hypothetical protein